MHDPRMSTNTAERVKALREQAGVSVRELARRLGKPVSSYLHYETPSRFKNGPLPVAFARDLATALAPNGISEADVMALAGFAPGEEPAPSPGDDLVSVYDVQAGAGNGVVVHDEAAVAQLAFPPGYLAQLTRARPADLAIIGVKGDSMLPTLADDDLVMIDRTKLDLSFDGLFVIRDGGDALLVKRIGRASKRGFVSIISDNRNVYPAVEKAIEEIEVIGRVIWKGGKV